ncbi:MAG: aminotransferase class V-fold PLP-dependent enzyme, partial [Thermoleophilia bacterium]|nr:aminotransferase class V-fold PLP-dependent enzyme [Thermoleophilia bacterium]
MKIEPVDSQAAEAFAELERGVQSALETYSNVHRGSGHNSVVSTHLFEQARDVVLEYLELDKGTLVVVFCSPRAAEALKARLEPGSYRSASSEDIGLPLGVRALAVGKKALHRAVPFESGGGTARLVSAGWVIWAAAPDRFEAGTPAIVNIIAFAKALQLIRQFGDDVFRDATDETPSATDILRHDELDQYSGRALLDTLRQTLIGGDARVPTAEGEQPYVNLDNAASTPTFTPIWEAVRRTWRGPRHVRQAIVQEVKTICADVLDAPLSEYDVIFTSNTTEAINLVAESLGVEAEQGSESVVINTLLEHNSNELPWRMIPGSSLIRVSFDAEGFVDLGELETLLREYNESAVHGERRVKVVAVSGASNVLGTCNDLGKISEVVHRYKARLLVDAAQLVAHRTVAMGSCGIDYLAFSAHKAYAPFGTGVLVARKGLLGFSSAERELIRSSGEENVGGIAALGKALVLLQRVGFDVIQERERALTERTLRGMAQIPGLTTYGISDPDSPTFALRGGVIPFSLKGMVSHTVARELSVRGGIGVRAGCHCAHLTVKRMLGIPLWAQQIQGVMLTVLRRMELPGVVRVSLGIENSEEDVDTLIRVLGEIPRKRGARVDKKSARRQMDDLAETA